MRVNKSKLIIGGVALAIFILAGGYAIYAIHKEKQEKQRIIEVETTRAKMLEGIYQDLLKDYTRYVDQATDRGYSESTRFKAVTKLNNLLGEKYYKNSNDYWGGYYYDYKLEYAKTDKDALRILRNQAKLQLVRKIYE